MPTYRIRVEHAQDHHPARIEVDPSGKVRAVYTEVGAEYDTLAEALADLGLTEDHIEEVAETGQGGASPAGGKA